MAKQKRKVAQAKQSTKGVEESIRLLARKYADQLKKAIDDRLEEMKNDDRSHFLVYQVLGIGDQEGRLVDEYQNKGRFLYKYAGSFLEEAAKLCFLEMFPDSGSARVTNSQVAGPRRLNRLPHRFRCNRDQMERRNDRRGSHYQGAHAHSCHSRCRACRGGVEADVAGRRRHGVRLRGPARFCTPCGVP